MTLEELRAHVPDSLASSLNSRQVAMRILACTNQMESEVVLTTAIDIARDLLGQIAKLQRELEGAQADRESLETDIKALERRLNELRAELKQIKRKTAKTGGTR